MHRRQIEAILSVNNMTKKTFRGVFPMDRLPASRQPGGYVINLDDHDEPGSHWVAVYDDGQEVEYMDSYGTPPLDLLCLQFVGPNYAYNTIPLQQRFSNACGFYCVYFLLQRARGFSAEHILKVLKRSDSGYVVKNFLYSRFRPMLK